MASSFQVLASVTTMCSRARALVQHGFTLIELMVTIAILAILMMVAAPSFNEAMLSNKLAGYANSFVTSALLARSEAIKHNGTVTLCRSSDLVTCANSGGWQQGWILRRVDIDSSGVSTTVIIQKQQALSSDYLFTGNAYSIDFPPGGDAVTNATLTLCRATPSPGSQERVITLTSTGRVTAKKTVTSLCS